MTHPQWLDRSLYPFPSHRHETPHGAMRYVDEGPRDAPPVLMVHGTPSWSFLFRDLIRDLRRDHRVVAVDHLGFGLSDKPRGVPYRPEDHAERLSGLVDALGLRDVTLVVHDFGGPIGLSRAIEHPDSVRALVIMNTWMWSLEGTASAKASRLFSTAFGRFLYTRLNFSARVLVKAAFADRKKLSGPVHRHYTAPFATREEREAPWVFARALRESGPWYESLWERRRTLEGLPMLVLWGMDDPLLGTGLLERWTGAFPEARVERLEGVGHFVPEEGDPERLARAIREHAATAAPRADPPG